MLNALDELLLEQIADLHGVPQGAYNIRKNGEKAGRATTVNIDITNKLDRPGIDITVKPHTKNESVHIPVIVTNSGLSDLVYNTFEIGEGADVMIVAGCGIHNAGKDKSQHDGIHEFFVRRGARIRYVEKHYGSGDGAGDKVLNPKTILHVEEDATVELELIQIRGVDSTRRDTQVHLSDRAKLVVTERLLTDGKEEAYSSISIDMPGAGSSAQIISRSVARGHSKQDFSFDLIGRNACRGHIQCDAIIMDEATVISTPRISAHNEYAQLIHEAAIGRLESQQLLKLESLGLSEQEAEDTILKGFLR